MTERLDEARKYVELYKTAMNDGYKKKANMYGLQATSILIDIYETTKNEEDVKEVVRLANDMLSVLEVDKYYDRTDIKLRRD